MESGDAEAYPRPPADDIRDAIEAPPRTPGRPRPKGGLFASGQMSLSQDADTALAGFGNH